MVKRWVILPKKSADITEQLLLNRKIAKDDWDSFLEPDFEKGLYDPFLMKNMRQATERVKLAVKNKETVGIFGDYDADGIPGAALLYDFLSRLGLKVLVYIPTREQGYGLNKEGIDFFQKAAARLIITIDLGVRNVAEIELAKKNGLDVIVLDHHEMGEEVPTCIVVNPKQKGDKYPFKDLAATGVVFKLIQGLFQEFKNIPRNYLKWALDLVAISTICDVVPLISENRIFAKFGLRVLRKTSRLGLAELYLKAGIDPENIDTYSVGFQIGPRLNAPGRLKCANESFYLLIAKNRKEAAMLAGKLDTINRRRQAELARVLKEAEEKVSHDGLEQKKVILISGSNWPSGIVGLVAGKLMEKFARPVIVCEKKGNLLRGSGRSIDGYNLVEALEASKEFLTRYGGHKKAAGLSLEWEHLANLYDRLLEVAEAKLKEEDLVPKITVDAKLETSEINLSLLDEIEKFEPFGLGNPRPVFCLEGATVSQLRTVGKEGKHLKCLINGIGVIGFDLGYLVGQLHKEQKLDLVFTIDEDIWDSRRKVQLKILDVKI